MEKSEIFIDEEFDVDIIKSEKNGALIARIDGVVTFIDCGDSIVAPHSTWHVRITYVGDRFMKAEALYKIRSAKENLDRVSELLEAIGEMTKRERELRKSQPKRGKNSYQYKSGNEIRQSR